MGSKPKECCCVEVHRTVRLALVLAGALVLQGFALLGQSGYPLVA
ncbi:hypothetical protein SAMN04488074_109222 [Lentzea albidocapillata subsp. violacea]|uniref:Uncharacterized protein n=1 Tax=Lentzea albidocapillata subsp. violacea TaxID=128104 RepID=A0A1G9I077_9PSEU|nr:hypothetical protein [Lentzea albidocapillata]SDL18512.1 hypothetical protein SAMN04488074_109222 [Lentzea albidocapillata subsp. violacea]